MDGRNIKVRIMTSIWWRRRIIMDQLGNKKRAHDMYSCTLASWKNNLYTRPVTEVWIEKVIWDMIYINLYLFFTKGTHCSTNSNVKTCAVLGYIFVCFLGSHRFLWTSPRGCDSQSAEPPLPGLSVGGLHSPKLAGRSGAGSLGQSTLCSQQPHGREAIQQVPLPREGSDFSFSLG
jgi:hypothetical protein